jgi:hypothetical protein
MSSYPSFRNQLEDLINVNSMENGSNTQDFVLADFLTTCLMAFDTAVTERTRLAEENPK